MELILQNTFDVSTLLGSNLRLALEHSVFPMDSKVILFFKLLKTSWQRDHQDHHVQVPPNLCLQGNAGSGQFLQVSGVKVVFDVRRPPGDRVVQVIMILILKKVMILKKIMIFSCLSW